MSIIKKVNARMIGIAIIAALILALCTSCGSGAGGNKKDSGNTGEALYCKLNVNCEKALEDGKLSDSRKKVLPADGIVYTSNKVEFQEGDTVFDVLQREMKANKIHMESSESPIYKSQYIKGINNLYEFDCGDMSGWMYKVNEEFPRTGCSNYKVKKNDNIQWIYSCELGKDIGGSNFDE